MSDEPAQPAEWTDGDLRADEHAHLRGKLGEEVVIGGKSANADTLADGCGQGFDLVETAVQLVDRCQSVGAIRKDFNQSVFPLMQTLI